MNLSSEPTPALPRRRNRRLLWLFGIAVYLGIYTFCSARGRYLGHNRGGQDNRDTWAPAYCAELYTSRVGRQKFRVTLCGWLFLPPMLIDQWLFHRTHFE